MSKNVNFNSNSQNISPIKIIGLVAILLVTVVMFGIYHGYKQNRLDTIEEITAMKLAHGWKPEKACMFLSHLDIKPKGYLPTKTPDIHECFYSLKMPYSKGEASLQYRVVGVEGSATNLSLVLAITDDMATKSNNDAQQVELDQLKEIFYGVTNDLMFVGAGRLLSEKEIGELKNIKLNGNIQIDSEFFNGTVQYYKIKNNLVAYRFELKGKQALQLLPKHSDAVQKE